MLERLLPRLEDSGSAKACLQGRCGSRALEWAERYCGELWSRVREEARGACFSIGSRGWEGVEFDWNSLTSWSPCDQAFLSLLTEIVANGRYREEALEVIGILDQRIAEEWIRLRNETGINDTKTQKRLVRNQLLDSGSITLRSRNILGLCPYRKRGRNCSYGSLSIAQGRSAPRDTPNSSRRRSLAGTAIFFVGAESGARDSGVVLGAHDRESVGERTVSPADRASGCGGDEFEGRDGRSETS